MASDEVLVRKVVGFADVIKLVNILSVTGKRDGGSALTILLVLALYGQYRPQEA